MSAQPNGPTLPDLLKQSATTGGPVLTVMLLVAWGLFRDNGDIKDKLHEADRDRDRLERKVREISDDVDRVERRTRRLVKTGPGQEP